MPVHHDVAHERDAKAVLVAEDAASDLMPVGDEQPAPLLLDDHGGEADGARACPVEGSGKRDGLDAVDGPPRIDAVHGPSEVGTAYTEAGFTAPVTGAALWRRKAATPKRISSVARRRPIFTSSLASRTGSGRCRGGRAGPRWQGRPRSR